MYTTVAVQSIACNLFFENLCGVRTTSKIPYEIEPYPPNSFLVGGSTTPSRGGSSPRGEAKPNPLASRSKAGSGAELEALKVITLRVDRPLVALSIAHGDA